MGDVVYADESCRIMGACFEVYEEKGGGFLEAVCQERLGIEFRRLGIPSVEQPRLRLEYRGHPLRQEYLPDFLCFERFILEVKALSVPADEHRVQVRNDLTAAGHKLGLLVNFGHCPKLEYERIVR